MKLHEIVCDLFEQFPELRPQCGNEPLSLYYTDDDTWAWQCITPGGTPLRRWITESEARAHCESSLMDALPEEWNLFRSQDDGAWVIYRTGSHGFDENVSQSHDRLTALVAAIRAAKEPAHDA